MLRDSLIRKIVKTVKGFVIFLILAAFISGCSSQPAEDSGKVNLTPNVKLASDVSLDEIQSETSQALSTTFTPYTLDDVLYYLSSKKPKQVEEQQVSGGPVSVRFVYPKPGSLIDKEIEFVIDAKSEDSEIDSVDIYLDGEKVTTLKTPPYTFSFNPEAYSKSRHTIKAVAYSGDFRGSSTMSFYNVVRGSVVVYPWKPAGGNLPYSYIKNYYLPDDTVMEVAMFTAYQSSNFYLDYTKQLPKGLAYYFVRVKLGGMVVADQNPLTLFTYFYNYTLKDYDRSQGLYELVLGSDPQALSLPKGYERYTFNPSETSVTGQYDSNLLSEPIIPFYGVDPYSKTIRLRITGPGPTKFYLRPIVLEYCGVEDTVKPTLKVSKVQLVSSDRIVNARFYVSEPVFATIYAYDSSGQVRSKTEPKPEGWVEFDIPDSDTRYVSIKITDCAGLSVTSKKIPVKR